MLILKPTSLHPVTTLLAFHVGAQRRPIETIELKHLLHEARSDTQTLPMEKSMSPTSYESRSHLLITLLAVLPLAACLVGEEPIDDEPTSIDEGASLPVRSGSVSAFSRQVVLPGLADPDAHVEGNTAYIVGTFDTKSLPVWRMTTTSPLKEIDPNNRFNPSHSDPRYDYCHVWAPDLTRFDGDWLISFSGTRVGNGTNCDNVGFARQQIFYSTSAANDPVDFGAPVAPNFGPGAPVSTSALECSGAGCQKRREMRIDSSVYTDAANDKTYISYTWFDNGTNHNATIDVANPTAIIPNTDPTRADEQGITEAPQIFKRGSGDATRYYLLYSTGAFNGQYRLRYLMANSVTNLRKDSVVSRDLTEAVFRGNGKLYETAGHGTIVSFGGKDFAVYHVGQMNQFGELVGRDTVISPISFNSDGTMRMLNALNVSWNPLSGRVYSVDVRSNGRWIGPCVDAGRLGQSTQVRLTDLCPHGDQLAPLETVDRVRVCHAVGGDWSRGKCDEAAFSRTRDNLFVQLTP